MEKNTKPTFAPYTIVDQAEGVTRDFRALLQIKWKRCDSAGRVLYTINKYPVSLIEAAPDMLLELKAQLERTPHRKGDCFSDDYRGLCVCGRASLEAVIAKAEK